MVVESSSLHIESEIYVQSTQEASEACVDSSLEAIEQERQGRRSCKEEVSILSADHMSKFHLRERTSRNDNRARRVVKVQRAIVGATLEDVSSYS
jgi:hypothetical protein